MLSNRSGSVIAVLDTTLDNRVEGGCSSNCEAQLGAALEDATAGGELDGLVVIEADPDMDINPVLGRLIITVNHMSEVQGKGLLLL